MNTKIMPLVAAFLLATFCATPAWAMPGAVTGTTTNVVFTAVSNSPSPSTEPTSTGESTPTGEPTPTGENPDATPEILPGVIPDSPAAVQAAKDAKGSRVVDNANVFSNSSEEEYARRIAEISRKYSQDVVLVTVSGLPDSTSTQYADDFYDWGDYGIGKEKSGILLLIDVKGREYATSTAGISITAFTDYGLAYIDDKVVAHLKLNEWQGAAAEFLTQVDIFMAEAAKGTPYDTNHPVDLGVLIKKSLKTGIPIGVIIALITVTAWRKRHKTAGKLPEANVYVVPGSLKLTDSQDVFVRTHTSKTRIDNDSGGGGGSSTHRSSSGSSHGGSSGRF